MAQKNMLHELLKQEQEPFHLKTYLAEKCYQMQKPTPKTTLQLRKHSKKVCFSSSQDAQYVKKPAFLQILSSVINSCKYSLDAAPLLHIPTHLLDEGQAKPKSQLKNDLLGLLGSTMKRFHNGDNNKMRDTGPEMRFASSSFRFSMCNSPPSSGGQTPDFSTPVASPSRHPEKENENYGTKVLKKEEMEQYSPLSVLEPSFEDFEDSHGSEDAEENCDFERGYANVLRTRQQLLYRLQRFEKLAELDPNDLERQLLEESDNKNGDNYQGEMEDRLDNAPLSMCRENNSPTNSTCRESTKLSTDTKKLAIEGKNIMILYTCSKLDSWKDIKFEVVFRMIESDFDRESDGWKEYIKEANEMAAEMEIEIFDRLMEQLLEEVQKCTGTSFKVMHLL